MALIAGRPAAPPSRAVAAVSAVPAANRHQVDVVWYSQESDCTDYDLAAKPGTVAYNEPRDYTFEGNTATTGAVPTSGWTTLATVTANTFASRQKAVDLTGYNWSVYP